MSSLAPASGELQRVDREYLREPIGKPMLWAVFFHVLLFAGAAGFALIAGLLPHNQWGGANDGGAIAVQLVSSAIPLPQDKPPNDNVLATETPSEAPAPPAPKAKAAVDESAIAIPTKMTPIKPASKKQEESKALKPAIQPPITSRNLSHAPPNPKLDNRAQYGEQASANQQRAMQTATTSANGQVAVNSGSRGFNFPWYIEGIQRKFAQSTYRGEVDPRTPAGTRAYIFFTIRRDGSPTDIRLDKSSGSPTLDRACLRAAQRVDTYGPLPSPPQDGNAVVSYYCEY